VKQQPLNAERWLRDLFASITALEDFAGYARAPESDYLGVELRQKTFKSHRIIFTLDELQHEVVIHYVRHGMRRGVGERDDA
jgi:plasmid stabilization system protein ParE